MFNNSIETASHPCVDDQCQHNSVRAVQFVKDTLEYWLENAPDIANEDELDAQVSILGAIIVGMLTRICLGMAPADYQNVSNMKMKDMLDHIPDILVARRQANADQS